MNEKRMNNVIFLAKLAKTNADVKQKSDDVADDNGFFLSVFPPSLTKSRADPRPRQGSGDRARTCTRARARIQNQRKRNVANCLSTSLAFFFFLLSL